MSFLGVWCDSVNCTLSITEERMEEILNLLHHWWNKRYATLRQVQSLAGKIEFCLLYSKIWEAVYIQDSGFH